MSEHPPLQSEDPLPISGEYSHRYNKEPLGTLGEIVVTDPRDPFVWLAKDVSNEYEMPSKNGKQLLWFIYRLNGNMPQTESDVKWRDDREDINSILKNISLTDIEAADRYIEHLVHLDAEAAINEINDQSLKPQSHTEILDQPDAFVKLDQSDRALDIIAIMRHLELIGNRQLQH